MSGPSNYEPVFCPHCGQKMPLAVWPEHNDAYHGGASIPTPPGQRERLIPAGPRERHG